MTTGSNRIVRRDKTENRGRSRGTGEEEEDRGYAANAVPRLQEC